MTFDCSSERIARCYEIARSALLAERNPAGHWTGELSTSALSTATACMALEMVRQKIDSAQTPAFDPPYPDVDFAGLISGGLAWLVEHQNDDGGWGDTVQSVSNISTTMLAHAVFCATGTSERYASTVEAAQGYIDKAGGVEAVLARYGKDQTFSIPILTHCTLAGVTDWADVLPLPFELACIPARFYNAVRLPVVSYALPALIAIGQVHYHHRPPTNPIIRAIRQWAGPRSLKVLEKIQPENGGFLEAAPLTSFVTMSLAGMGRIDHPVARKGVQFLVNSVRPDGSWPIDTNLATWVTTLSINALGDDLPEESRPVLREWLLGQQHRQRHPYTNAAPGGWAWTDLPGGVPDADDTPGAILALLSLCDDRRAGDVSPPLERDELAEPLANAVRWLLDLQNRDRGWPTFCRGWGTLPFDRSAADITAHVLRALIAWQQHPASQCADRKLRRRTERAVQSGFGYLAQSQRSDGSWLPLWFGNQYAPGNENPTYGTARVLAAYRDLGELNGQDENRNSVPPRAVAAARRGLQWLREAQNVDGGWGGAAGVESSVEETALAVDVLLADSPTDKAAQRGLMWLLERVEDGRFHESTPIGFYFAELWYFEKLYPLVFILTALRRAHHIALTSRFTDVTRVEKRERVTS
jgi:squalene-hopene/tetraprenyl-beta-curcumene cyclase